MWYLIITTTIGFVDLSTVGNFFPQEKDAEEFAAKARALPFVTKVEVRHT